ncbi:hypothetical protein OG21DRAFT_512202 [Imleria badia]|nr:hypothetical protein OG21DRAFT_512202 [Imleria badia]
MNVNLDVLELILAQLASADLVAAAAASRAFLACAIPFLYSRIEYTDSHLKRAKHEMSPFATIAAHDHLGVHVKRIALHAAPLPRSSRLIHPAFLKDFALALTTTTNLRSFVCTVNGASPLLHHLVDKHRLSHIRISTYLSSRQMPLHDHIGLHSLSLDSPSQYVIDILPKWTANMQKTLAHLTLFESYEMDITVLIPTLAQLPRLRGLHVISNYRISHLTVLKALSHTPDLRELSFTIFRSREVSLPPLNFSIPPITHLSIDISASYNPGLKSLLARIISLLSPKEALAICGGWIGEIKALQSALTYQLMTMETVPVEAEAEAVIMTYLAILTLIQAHLHSSLHSLPRSRFFIFPRFPPPGSERSWIAAKASRCWESS